MLIVRAAHLDNKKETEWYQHSVSRRRNDMYEYRYVVISVPENKGKPVIWYVNDLETALKIKSAALQIGGQVVLIDLAKLPLP